MPLVVVRYKEEQVLEDILTKLARELPDIVASALNTPEHKDGTLTPDDIEVWVQKSGKYDVNTKDLEIIIWANFYPERQTNLEGRKQTIIDDVRTFFADYDRNLSGFVWVLLNPAAFGNL